MDVRKKLVEIIQNSVGGCAGYWAEVIANGLIAHGVTVQQWISVKDRLPEERDSIFKKMYGTKQWLPGMFCTVSDNVLVSIEREDGTRCVRYMHTQGGEWNLDSMPWAKKVTHWMPLPQPPKGE